MAFFLRLKPQWLDSANAPTFRPEAARAFNSADEAKQALDNPPRPRTWSVEDVIVVDQDGNPVEE